MTKPLEMVEALHIFLHGHSVGVLSHYQGGKNIFTFDPTFREAPAYFSAPTFSLGQKMDDDFFHSPWVTNQRLHPIFSNLLPEGVLRTWMAQSLKTHQDNEFVLLANVGRNLPGAIEAWPITQGRIPDLRWLPSCIW
ncbi:MAG: HipA N-terminal domain-containing protein [Thiomicrospira sp.]